MLFIRQGKILLFFLLKYYALLQSDSNERNKGTRKGLADEFSSSFILNSL